MAGLLPEGKLHFLFALLPPDVVARLRLDEVACYSITDARTARQCTRLLLRLPGLHGAAAAPSIVDATACVGGNTISFAADGFARVVGIELDAGRADMLRHNVGVVRTHLGGGGGFSGDVSVVRADFLQMLDAAHPASAARGSVPPAAPPLSAADVLFLDPPWGGVGYRESESVCGQ